MKFKGVTFNGVAQQIPELLDISLEPDVLAGPGEVFLSDTGVHTRVMEQKGGKFGALLDEVLHREDCRLTFKFSAGNAHYLAQDVPGIMEAEPGQDRWQPDKALRPLLGFAYAPSFALWLNCANAGTG